jgi:hypothetical protein
VKRLPHRSQMNQRAELPVCASSSTLSIRWQFGQGGGGVRFDQSHRSKLFRRRRFDCAINVLACAIKRRVSLGIAALPEMLVRLLSPMGRNVRKLTQRTLVPGTAEQDSRISSAVCLA